MVTKSSTNQYMSRMGQNTGTSKTEKNVITKPIRIALKEEYLRQHTLHQSPALPESHEEVLFAARHFSYRVNVRYSQPQGQELRKDGLPGSRR